MSKKKSIAIYTIFAVILILLTIFTFITFNCGDYGEYVFKGFLYNIQKGLDLSGGVRAEYLVQNSGEGDIDTRIDGTKKSLENILYQHGFSEAVVSSSTRVNGDKVITVEVPNVEDPETIFALIGRPASLEITDNSEYGKGKTWIIGKKHISKAYVTTNPERPGEYAVALEFNEKGKAEFAKATQENKDKELYFFAQKSNMLGEGRGVKVNDVISNGKAIITGGYDYDTANDFAVRIQAGTFGVDMTLDKSEVISPTLGENAVRNGLIAGAVALGLILIFMACVYGVFGVLADIALLFYSVLLLVMLSIIPWVQLTLPGIAGIILGIGMAVDANIIVFERIKDEYRAGKPIPTAVHNGFKRATSAVLDGNITTIIGALVLYGLGSASIKGFAIVLIISIILSLFSTLVLSRLFIKMALPFNSSNPKPYRLKREEVVDNEE